MIQEGRVVKCSGQCIIKKTERKRDPKDQHEICIPNRAQTENEAFTPPEKVLYHLPTVRDIW